MADDRANLVLRIEALLFAAGKPLAAREIADALELEDAHPVAPALKTLEQTYGRRPSALEVRRVGDRYALQLREEYVPVVHSVTPVEMAPRTLKALTLIAYHQPILQSVLVRMIGESAYEEVSHLRGLGLIHPEPKGATLELTTTRRFAEYFGIASGRPEEIRRFLEQKLGVVPQPRPTGPATPAEEAPSGTPAAPPTTEGDGAGPAAAPPAPPTPGPA